MLLIGFMSISVFTTAVSAANVTDTSYSFWVAADSPTVYTTARAKENTSSTYVNITKVPSKYAHCDVQGYRPSSDGKFSWTDETVGNKPVNLTVGKWLVRQNVYEHGGRKARLKFVKDDYNGYVKGLWSPDSAGTYPKAN